MNKICTKCKINLPLDEFYLRSNGQGYRSQCKKCHLGSKDLTCLVCKEIHNRYSLNRKSAVCMDCYPKYRTGYSLIEAAKSRAKKKNIAFDLDMNWILPLLNTCPMTGKKFTYFLNGSNYGNRHTLAPSIDKIDPKGGYTKENCRVVCWFYNMTKSYYSDEEVLELCKAIVSTSGMNLAQDVGKKEETNQGIT